MVSMGLGSHAVNLDRFREARAKVNMRRQEVFRWSFLRPDALHIHFDMIMLIIIIIELFAIADLFFGYFTQNNEAIPVNCRIELNLYLDLVVHNRRLSFFHDIHCAAM